MSETNSQLGKKCTYIELLQKGTNTKLVSINHLFSLSPHSSLILQRHMFEMNYVFFPYLKGRRRLQIELCKVKYLKALSCDGKVHF